jgi:hypothetical protein
MPGHWAGGGSLLVVARGGLLQTFPRNRALLLIASVRGYNLPTLVS